MPSATPHQALYRRWRAQTFEQIVGQAAVVETLRNAVRLDRLSHGFLFVGPRGTGKTSLARILAKAVNCANPVEGEPDDTCEACVAIREGRALDVIELDAASNNTVQDMRDLVPRVYTATADLRRKVFIVDEVQRIKEGWDVLLKTLEEPPDDVLFIFCTTNPAQIRPAVVSRLQRFTFRPLSVAEISGKLVRILAEEGRAAEPDAVALIAQLAAGGMRDAESMLDQLLNAGDGPLTEAAVRDLLGLADDAAVGAFVEALAGGDALSGIAVLDRLEQEGRDLVAFADQVVARLRIAVVARLQGSASGLTAADLLPPAALAGIARRVAALDANRIGAGGYRFQLELLLLQGAAALEDATPLEEAATPTANSPHPRAPRLSPETSPAAAEQPPLEPQSPVPARHSVPIETSPAASTPAAARAAGPASAVDRAPAPSTADPEALARLREGWPDFVREVGGNPALRAIIEVCRPVDVRDGVVVLCFPEDRPFYRDKAEQRRTALEAGVEQVLGRSYAVRCVATNVEAIGPPAREGDEADLVERFKEVFAGDLVDVAEIS
ncbi:MAG: DNA polymerase III subunit gamma/tau [Candidatus Limnocylindrales bacterium]